MRRFLGGASLLELIASNRELLAIAQSAHRLQLDRIPLHAARRNERAPGHGLRPGRLLVPRVSGREKTLKCK